MGSENTGIYIMYAEKCPVCNGSTEGSFHFVREYMIGPTEVKECQRVLPDGNLKVFSLVRPPIPPAFVKIDLSLLGV